MRREVVVVVAAGVGRRLGRTSEGPKALTTVAGSTLLDLALQGLRAAAVRDIVVVHTPGHDAAFADICGRHAVDQFVAGGADRTESVRAGLDLVEAAAEVVAVHDAARALTPPEVIRRVLDAVGGDVVAAAPGLAVADTLKRVEDDVVTGTVDRTGLCAVHTPQAFRPDVLRDALAGGDHATDELALVERAIADGRVEGRIQLVAGSHWDVKITYPEDLRLAEALLAPTRPGGAA